MARRVEFLGIRLPMSHPMMHFIAPALSKRDHAALMAVEQAGIGMVVIPRVTAFRVGPDQGFSKWYHFDWTNRYTEDMTPSDAAHLFRGGIVEVEAFRDLDYPPHRKKQADYPSLKLMSVMRVKDTMTGRTYNVTAEQARIVQRVLNHAKKMKVPPPLIESEHGKSGALTENAKRILRSTGPRSRR